MGQGTQNSLDVLRKEVFRVWVSQKRNKETSLSLDGGREIKKGT